MNDTWTDRWNERYSSHDFAYGTSPNLFFKEEITKLPVGTILFPAEGEGRNAVFAASLGWDTFAFDISVEGKNKAMRLAESCNVSIDYQVSLLENMNYHSEQFDVIALIYAHFPADIKSKYHKTLSSYVKKDGIIIFEYIQQNEKVGGPRDIDQLFSIEEIQSDFDSYHIITLEEKEIELQEGLFHNGIGSVIRFVGQKK